MPKNADKYNIIVHNFNFAMSRIYRTLAERKCNKGDFDGSIADYNRSSELSPKYKTLNNNSIEKMKSKADAPRHIVIGWLS